MNLALDGKESQSAGSSKVPWTVTYDLDTISRLLAQVKLMTRIRREDPELWQRIKDFAKRPPDRKESRCKT